jgi:hypothetical protein
VERRAENLEIKEMKGLEFVKDHHHNMEKLDYMKE